MLTISKASAGAGKTYKLTGHYLRMLFEEFRQGREEPYRHILAVIFTNKATAEMKGRILKELNALADGSPSDFLPELVPMVKDSGLTSAQKEAEVRKWAGTLLRAILNDYTGFNMSTIDSFFQLILRAFAREMGQSSTYAVNINSDEILVEAAVSDGDITASEGEQALEQVFLRLAQARQAGYSWFDGSFRVICEVPVLYPGGKERRPDRVMVSGNRAVVNEGIEE